MTQGRQLTTVCTLFNCREKGNSESRIFHQPETFDSVANHSTLSFIGTWLVPPQALNLKFWWINESQKFRPRCPLHGANGFPNVSWIPQWMTEKSRQLEPVVFSIFSIKKKVRQVSRNLVQDGVQQARKTLFKTFVMSQGYCNRGRG